MPCRLPTAPAVVKLPQHGSVVPERNQLAPRRSALPQRPRDFQRSRLYRWESANVLPRDRRTLSLDACRDLAREVFAARLAEPPPRIEDGRGRRHAAGSRQVIKLPRWARTRPIVLHECAHGLSTDAHGPDFVRVYLELLAAFLGWDRTELEHSALLSGLKISAPGRPVPVPSASWTIATVRLPRSLAARLLAIGIRGFADLRRLGPVQVWVELRREFGKVVGQNSLFTLATLGSTDPAAELDGRTRAHLKFEAAGRLIEANRATNLLDASVVSSQAVPRQARSG